MKKTTRPAAANPAKKDETWSRKITYRPRENGGYHAELLGGAGVGAPAVTVERHGTHPTNWVAKTQDRSKIVQRGSRTKAVNWLYRSLGF